MAHVFTVGSTVRNFNTTAKVVALFSSPHGTVEETGWPILREIGANGRLRGGKWVADPAKCELLAE